MQIRDESKFRKYYYVDSNYIRSTKYYKHCTECEKVNNRYKYITRKNIEPDERQKIDEFYRLLESKGGKCPSYGSRRYNVSGEVGARVIEELSKVVGSLETTKEHRHLQMLNMTPDEWLDTDLSNYDASYLYDEFFDEYNDKWAPILDKVIIPGCVPNRDKTYSVQLDEIYRIFKANDKASR